MAEVEGAVKVKLTQEAEQKRLQSTIGKELTYPSDALMSKVQQTLTKELIKLKQDFYYIYFPLEETQFKTLKVLYKSDRSLFIEERAEGTTNYWFALPKDVAEKIITIPPTPVQSTTSSMNAACPFSLEKILDIIDILSKIENDQFYEDTGYIYFLIWQEDYQHLASKADFHQQNFLLEYYTEEETQYWMRIPKNFFNAMSPLALKSELDRTAGFLRILFVRYLYTSLLLEKILEWCNPSAETEFDMMFCHNCEIGNILFNPIVADSDGQPLKRFSFILSEEMFEEFKRKNPELIDTLLNESKPYPIHFEPLDETPVRVKVKLDMRFAFFIIQVNGKEPTEANNLSTLLEAYLKDNQELYATKPDAMTPSFRR